ncbi:MAG: SusE domain-containing protein [Bacteroidales bacterium]
MKKITFFLIAIIGLGILFSCEKETTDPVLDMSKAEAPILTQPEEGSAFVLTEELADSTFTFNWAPASYNLNDLEDTKYTLEIAMADSNFVESKEITNTSNTTHTMTVAELNSLLTSAGAVEGIAMDYEVRIFSFVNTASEYTNQYSGTTKLTFTTYATQVEYSKLYVPGDYQGWAPDVAPVIYDFDGDGVYNGYIYFPEGGTFEFKFTSDPNWDGTNYGSGGEGLLDTDAGAGNLTVPEAGGYQFTVDINDLTWSYELQNWGVIGQWLNWESDIDLTWDVETQDLSVTVENIPAAEDQRFKFRANDGWDLNLGAIDPPDGETLTYGGTDIEILDGGTITFILRFTTPEPTYELVYP